MKTPRDIFRESVFARDSYQCVLCNYSRKAYSQPLWELDAHHIIERRLWPDGGYHINNGATLCGPCHIKAESTEVSCEIIRERAGITEVLLPEEYYKDHIYTKWGDIILSDGRRMPGPLFWDESVQKILKVGPNFDFYVNYIKYPRTYHLPWSESKTDDDRTLIDCSQFIGKEVIVTTKMDGENTTIYKDYCHARSIDGRDHWSRSWVKNLQAKIGWEIPDGWRICGENLYAKHSIKYDDLNSYFYVFSIWNDKNVCLSWEETTEYANILGLDTVPVLYSGIYDEEQIKSLYSNEHREKMEGYVIRVADSFEYKDFKKSIAKFVRREHIATSHHWFFTSNEKNELI